MSSDLTLIYATLGVFALMVLCLVFLMTRGHQRLDEIVTGLANGVPISTKYRWILVFYDFWGYVFVGAFLLVVFALGFHVAADLADSSRATAITNLCAIACVIMLVGFLILCISLTFYMASVIRQTTRTSP